MAIALRSTPFLHSRVLAAGAGLMTLSTGAISVTEIMVAVDPAANPLLYIATVSTMSVFTFVATILFALTYDVLRRGFSPQWLTQKPPYFAIIAMAVLLPSACRALLALASGSTAYPAATSTALVALSLIFTVGAFMAGRSTADLSQIFSFTK